MMIGIDLGTTNSAASYWKDGKAHLIPNALGDFLTPSVVSLDHDDNLLIGMAARERKSVDPERTQSVFKRHMGKGIKLGLGKKTYSPEELSALVLRALKHDAEVHLGQIVDEAVITVPAYFNDRQRKATKRAGELAGFKVRRLINEPTAAALAYGIIERDDKEPFLVFDLGGGTFDVSIVEVFEGIVEVRATAGDNFLGGEDFNDVVIALALQKMKFGKGEHSIALVERLKQAAEKTRRLLSRQKKALFSFVWRDKVYEVEISEDEFEHGAQELIEHLRSPVLRSLRDASIKAMDLSELVLVGGSTRMPVVRKAVAKMFGRFANHLIDPDHAVALGAATVCGLIEKDVELNEVRLTDVSPFTMGVGAVDDDHHGNWHEVYVPMINRNTVLPASRSHVFSTIKDRQSKINFVIYQGEARKLEDNLKLGEISTTIPRRPAGEVVVECRFSYDISGLLEVDISVPGTDIQKQLVIVDREDVLDEKELENRRSVLAALKFHPRENAVNTALLARGAKCYEALLGIERDRVDNALREFESILEGQNPREILDAQKSLKELLDHIEGDRFL